MISALRITTLGVLCAACFGGIAFASNTTNYKDSLVNKITTLENTVTADKNTHISSLENQVLTISNSYDAIFTRLGYDTKVVEFLVSLGQLNNNFKADMLSEMNTIQKELTDGSTDILTQLASLKTNIRFNYQTVGEKDKDTFQKNIDSLQQTATNLKETAGTKTTALVTKYNNQLSGYENQVKNAYNTNSGNIGVLSTFAKKYDELYTVYSEFDRHYRVFKETYLAYSGDLTLYSQDRQKYYATRLENELKRLVQINIDSNSPLASYSGDLNRFVEILMTNFRNSLKNHVDDAYGVLSSDVDVSSLITRYQNVTNKYYDTDGKIKAREVLNSPGANGEVEYILTKFKEIHASVVDLVGSNASNSTAYENIKIRLDNTMIRFYNDQSQKYLTDITNSIKEKINLIDLEEKNALTAIGAIDFRYRAYAEKTASMKDIHQIQTEYNRFKQDMGVYLLLGNPNVENRVNQLLYAADVVVTKKHMNASKYASRDQSQFNQTAHSVTTLIKTQRPNTYRDIMKKAVDMFDILLGQPLNDIDQYTIRSVKIALLEELQKPAETKK